MTFHIPGEDRYYFIYVKVLPTTLKSVNIYLYDELFFSSLNSMLHPPPVLAFYFIRKRCDSQLSPMKSHHKTNVDVSTQKILQDVDPFFSLSFLTLLSKKQKKSGTFGTRKEDQKKLIRRVHWTWPQKKRKRKTNFEWMNILKYLINKNHTHRNI